MSRRRAEAIRRMPSCVTTSWSFGLTQIGMLWWMAAAAAPAGHSSPESPPPIASVPWAAIEQLLAGGHEARSLAADVV